MRKINPESISIIHINVYKSIVSPSDIYVDNPQKPSNFRVSYSHNFAINVKFVCVWKRCWMELIRKKNR